MLQYGFIENVDFTGVKSFTVVNNGAKKEIEDHLIKLSMAKEIAINRKRGKLIWLKWHYTLKLLDIMIMKKVI